MSQINEEKIEQTKKFIRSLSELQDELYTNLLEETDVCPEVEDFLFDYVHNSNFTTFAAYLEAYGYDGPIYESQEAKINCPKLQTI
jgi:hypothetical protein